MTQAYFSSKQFNWLSLLLLVVVYLLGSAVFPLFDLDEGAYTEVSREMVANQNYLATTVNNETFFHKPALMYWVQALSINIFGQSEFGYRLPSVVALVLWLMSIFSFVKQYINEQSAQLAVLVALTSAGVTVLFKSAIPDAFLNLFISLAIFSSYHYLQTLEKKHLLMAYAAMALGMLTKGPVAIVIPFFALSVFLLIKKQPKSLLPAYFYLPGWLLFVAIAAPWYVIQYLKYGDAFIAGFFGEHNVGRFMVAMEGHSGGPLFYVGALLMLTLPFTSPLLKSFVSLIKNKLSDIQLLLWIWFGFVFIFFTIAATKLPHYLMYGLTPIWILISLQIKQIKYFSLALMPLLLLVVIIAAFPYLLDQLSHSFDDPYIHQTYQNIYTDLPDVYYWMLIASVVAFIVLLFYKGADNVHKLIASGVVSSLLLSFCFLPFVGNIQQGAVKQAGLMAKQQNLEVILWDLNMPSFNVYAQKVSEVRKPQVGEIVLTKKQNLKQFKNVEMLLQHRGIALAKILE